jgi:uncharacterized protein YchJ
MQEVEYSDGRKVKELFHNFEEMRARTQELEKDGDIVKLTRKQFTPNSKCWCGSSKKVKKCCGKVG